MIPVLIRSGTMVPLALAFTLTGCEREPPPELVQELDAVRAERDGLQEELREARTTLRAISEELREVDFPEEVRDVPPRTAPDSLRAALRGSAERLAESRNELQRIRGRTAALQRRVDSLDSALARVTTEYEARLSEERVRSATLEGQASALTARGEGLQAEVDRLTRAVASFEAEANRAYWVAGTREELRRRGLIEREGGARVLFVLWKRGEALVPARDLDSGEFTAIDLRETLEIPLPRSDVRYRVVSRQSLDHVEAEARASERVRGPAIRITDPEAFWRTSRFLILVEDDG